MGTLFSAFDIARSGLQAAQVQLDVSAHNIANANREGYSRQRVTLGARLPIKRSFGDLGRGVQVQDIERVRDEFLDNVYRQQNPGLGQAQVRASYFSQLEDLLQEPGENGFSTRMNVFFDALSDYVTNVEELPVRMSVISEAQSLATVFNEFAVNFDTLRTNANEEVRGIVPEINSLTERIAALNKNIVDAEVSGAKANDLRDDRDRLIDELSGLVNITYRERENGQVDVLVSGEVLVEGVHARALETVRDPSLDPNRQDLLRVQFEDNGLSVEIRSGELYGALQARDVDIVEASNRLDTIAATIINEINRIHSTGNGLDNWSGTVTGSNSATSSSTPLSSAGLPFSVSPGSFDVIVYDATGTPTTTTINITAATTLDSLAADLSAIPNFTASVTTDNTLSLGTTGTNTFSFANDSSGVLPALGINGLFTGTNARNMGVNQDVVDNPRLLTSAYSTDILETGDNQAAIDMANVRSALVLEGGTATINDYYESTVVRIGTAARSNLDILDVQQSFVDDFQRRRTEVSGVSIDEEVTNLLLYQRAFEASARIVTVADRMLDALFAAVG